MTTLRRSTGLIVLCVLGTLGGAWLAISPWVLGYPAGTGQSWTTSISSSFWTGVSVSGASLLGLVAVSASAVWGALQSPRPAARSDADGSGGGSNDTSLGARHPAP